jgi:hypothetical protein
VGAYLPSPWPSQRAWTAPGSERCRSTRGRTCYEIRPSPVRVPTRSPQGASASSSIPVTPTTLASWTWTSPPNGAGAGEASAGFLVPRANPASAADLGDALLMRLGLTLIWVGRQFDVPQRPRLLRLEVPRASDGERAIRGLARSAWTVDREVATLPRGHRGHIADPAAAPQDPRNILTRRDARLGARHVVANRQWSFTAERRHITLAGGFAPGYIYELVYVALDPTVVGLGLARYLAESRQAAQSLVSERFLLAEDLTRVQDRAPALAKFVRPRWAPAPMDTGARNPCARGNGAAETPHPMATGRNAERPALWSADCTRPARRSTAPPGADAPSETACLGQTPPGPASRVSPGTGSA